MGAAAFVLVISSANVANLTLMRTVRREHELVVRAALGSGAARLRRLMLVENLVLAAAGAVPRLLVARGPPAPPLLLGPRLPALLKPNPPSGGGPLLSRP